ncbi:homoserine kinase [compost metagenome]
MESFNDLSHDQQVRCLHDLARAALEHWDGAFGELELVKYRENAVFSARRNDGQRVALRIHRNGYHSPAALRSELEWMDALACAGIKVPQLIRTRWDTHLIEVSTPEIGESRQIDMLAWLPGNAPGSAEHGLDPQTPVDFLFFEAGAMAARIHRHSAEWQQSDDFHRHAWDEEGLIGHQPFWGRFWEFEGLTGEQRELLLELRRAARIDLRRYGRTLDNYGMIHADLVPENLLLDDTRLRLIDFDDAGFGWHMFELATALYFCLDDPRLEDIREALFVGYQSVKPLTAADRDALPLFLALRGTTYLGWLHTRQNSEINASLGPLLVERACRLVRDYLDSRAR